MSLKARFSAGLNAWAKLTKDGIPGAKVGFGASLGNTDGLAEGTWGVKGAVAEATTVTIGVALGTELGVAEGTDDEGKTVADGKAVEEGALLCVQPSNNKPSNKTPKRDDRWNIIIKTPAKAKARRK